MSYSLCVCYHTPHARTHARTHAHTHTHTPTPHHKQHGGIDSTTSAQDLLQTSGQHLTGYKRWIHGGIDSTTSAQDLLQTSGQHLTGYKRWIHGGIDSTTSAQDLLQTSGQHLTGYKRWMHQHAPTPHFHSLKQTAAAILHKWYNLTATHKDVHLHQK